MKRRRGARARLEELAILLNDCAPFNDLLLRVYFLSNEDLGLFCTIAERKKFSNIEACSLDEMPFAKRESTKKQQKKSLARKEEAPEVH